MEILAVLVGIFLVGCVVVPPVLLLTLRLTRRLAFRNATRRPREGVLVIVGSMLATALMTASFVIGDSFTASIRDVAYRQLGPVDEVATAVGSEAGNALFAAFEGAESEAPPEIDGVVTAKSAGAAMATLDGDAATAAAPRAQLLEMDFASAIEFGGDAAATGLVGDTPVDGEAAITTDLARKLDVEVGDAFTAFVYGTSTDLTVSRVLDRTGLAGFWLGRESSSYNAFVAPGTIERLADAGQVTGAPPTFLVLVSNRGNVLDGADATTEAMRWATRRVGDSQANVLAVKQDLLDAAEEQGDGLSQFYTSISSFAVMAGILLLVNIFLMLAAERRAELGMMRAMGMRRRALIAAFASEGWLYAILASVLGTGVGLVVGRLVTKGAEQIINSGDEEVGLAIRFSASPESLVQGFAIGLMIAMVTIVIVSITTSRFNIIGAIRDLERPRRRAGWISAVAWSLLVALGVAMALGSFAGANAGGIIAAPALVILGVAALLRRVLPDRPVLTGGCLATLTWGVVAVLIAAGADADLEVFAFITQGMVLVVAAVLLVNEYQNELGHALGRLTGGNLSVRLGLAYPIAKRGRTALTLGQFAIVVFILTYISVLSHMFGTQTEGTVRDISGGYSALVRGSSGNPVPWAELRAFDGVERVSPMVNRGYDITPPDETEPTTWSMTGFDEAFVNGGPPKLEDRGRFATDEAAYRAVLEDPSLAIVDSFFLGGGAGPPVAAVGIGDTISVRDLQTGVSKNLTVIAEGPDDWVFNGGLMNTAVAQELSGGTAVENRAYVSADEPDAFADLIEAKYFANGAEADSIKTLVEDNLSQQRSFFTLMRAFLAVGLVIGIAGIGVIMVRAVRERRRQVGVLRALGFPADSVSNAFAIEAGFVALEGVLIGVLLGFVCTWSITFSDSFGEGFTFSVPWLTIGVLVAGTLIGALVATIGPARSAAKIKPAVALRIAD